MEDENEVTQEVSELKVADIYPQATELWPLIPVACVAALVILACVFATEIKKRATFPYGHGFAAIGTIVDCQPANPYRGDGPYRSFIRTPKDEVFSVYWRYAHQPPQFGMAIGKIQYHECGVQDEMNVYCFDSFAFSGEGAKPLDLNGKSVRATGALLK